MAHENAALNRSPHNSHRFAPRPPPPSAATTSSQLEAAKESSAPNSYESNSPGVTVQRLQCFKTKRCRFWMEGRCTRGDSCTYAHTDVELRSPPDLTKTKICSRWKRNACDKSPEQCAYAHGADDLRDTNTPSTSASTTRRALSSNQDEGGAEGAKHSCTGESCTLDNSVPSFGLITGTDDERCSSDDDDGASSEGAFIPGGWQRDFSTDGFLSARSHVPDFSPPRRVALLQFRSPTSEEQKDDFGDATPIGRNAAVLPVPPDKSFWLASASMEELSQISSPRLTLAQLDELERFSTPRLYRSDSLLSSCESDCSLIRPTIRHVIQVTSEAYFD